MVRFLFRKMLPERENSCKRPWAFIGDFTVYHMDYLLGNTLTGSYDEKLQCTSQKIQKNFVTHMRP